MASSFRSVSAPVSVLVSFPNASAAPPCSRARSGNGPPSWTPAGRQSHSVSSTSDWVTRGDLHLALHRDEACRTRFDLRPGLQGQGRQSPRRQQVLPIARAGEHTRDGLLVADPLRHRDSLDGPESEQRRSPLVVGRRSQERRRLDRSLLRPPGAIGRGEQLPRDRTRERLLPDVPLLHPHRAAVRRHVVTARYRADLTTLIGHAPMKASHAATSWELHIS